MMEMMLNLVVMMARASVEQWCDVDEEKSVQMKIEATITPKGHKRLETAFRCLNCSNCCPNIDMLRKMEVMLKVKA